jgi:uncharacterized membrane protein YwzB
VIDGVIKNQINKQQDATLKGKNPQEGLHYMKLIIVNILVGYFVVNQFIIICHLYNLRITLEGKNPQEGLHYMKLIIVNILVGYFVVNPFIIICHLYNLRMLHLS